MNLIKTDGIAMNYFNYQKRDVVFPIPDKDRPLTILDLTFCIEGEMHYWYNGESITLHAGDGILLLPGSYRERYETPNPGALYASINLFIEDRHEFEFEIEGYLPNVVNSNILFLLDILKKEYPVVTDKREEKILSLFSYIYNNVYETICNTENPHVKAIKQYIFDNLTEELSLEKIANHVHLAPQYICTLFKKEVGTTIMQFILKSRIEHAKMAIIATTEPISKIAEGCGFDDYCYFSHVFKKITGVSARQYRATKQR